MCLAGFARQGPAVATLSIFVEPMTRGFGWSRTALSGAVSLGGVLAALTSPLIGPVLDRRGARLILGIAVCVTGDYFGRASYGAIRGVALTVQVSAQASGPLLSGLIRDRTGDYVASLSCFAVLSVVGVLVALLIRASRPPRRATGGA